MADRTVVRQGPVVSLSLGAVLALAALGPGPDGTTPTSTPAPSVKDLKASGKAGAAVVPIEKRPYKIRAWLAVDPRARVDHRGRETLLAGWKVLIGRFVGAPWNVDVAEGDGPLATNDLDDVTPEMVIPLAKGYDKAWLLKVEPDPDGGLRVVGREFDAATAKIGLICRRPATVLAEGPRALLQLSLDIFAPSAEIAEAAGGNQRLKVQGALLQAADPIGQVVKVGSVFRPTRIFYKPDGGILKLEVIQRTYLRADSIEGGIASCAVYSALGNPFTTKVVGKAKMVAVGLKPTGLPTKLRFLTMKPEQRPLAGYDLIARPAPDGSPRQVGTTDREGRIVLEPNFSDGLVILRLMAAGIEPLVQLPVMPGESDEEYTVTGIDPRSQAVTAESELYALQAEIVDLIATRHRLKTRLQARSSAQNWDEVKVLLEEFRKLSPRAVYASQVEKLDKELTTQQNENKRQQIRTRTAQNLLGDTRGLIDRYLDDEDFEMYQRAYNEFQQTSGKGGTAKALPKAPPLPMGGAAKPRGTSGAIDLAPPGAGFTLIMPGTPSETSGKTPDGSGDIKGYSFTDPAAKAKFVVEYRDYPLAITPEAIPRVIDSERDRIGATFPGSKLAREKVINIGGQDGKEVEFELTTKGVTLGNISRIVLVNSRIFAVSVRGPKEALSSKAATEFLDSFRPTGRGGAATAAAPAPAPATPSAPAAEAKGAAATKKAPKAPSPAARPSTPGAGGNSATPF